MRVTIIRDDNTVSVDGEGYTVDCTGLPADFHALQWDGTSGEIEYRMVVCSHCNTRSKKPNLFINDMTPYLPYVDRWELAKHDAKASAARDAEAAALQNTVLLASGAEEEKARISNLISAHLEAERAAADAAG